MICRIYIAREHRLTSKHVPSPGLIPTIVLLFLLVPVSADTLLGLLLLRVAGAADVWPPVLVLIVRGRRLVVRVPRLLARATSGLLLRIPVLGRVRRVVIVVVR